MALNHQVFTNAGIDMLGQADAGTLLTIDKIVVGAGTATQDSDIYPLTALIQWKADVTIVRKVDLHGGKMLVSGVLNEWELTGAPFQLRELGIMAHTGTGAGGTQQTTGPAPAPPAPSVPPPSPGPSPNPVVTSSPTLYCASNVYTDPPDTVTPGGLNSYAFDIEVEIDRATNVTVVIGDATTVDCANIPADPTVGPGVYDRRVGNLFYFKRLKQGQGILLTGTGNDGDDNPIQISAAQLVNNIDLYVPMNNPDVPINPSTNQPYPNTLFATIQAAHDYLTQFTIPAQYFATIHVHEATNQVIQVASSININHPNAIQIRIIGQPPVAYPITHIALHGAGPDKDLTINNVAGLATGQFCAVVDSFWGWGGGCYLTAAPRPGVVQVNTYDQSGQPMYNKIDTGGSSPRLLRMPTTLQMTTTPTGIAGMINLPYGIGLIMNICFVGDPRAVAPANNQLNYTTYIIDGGGIGGHLINVWTFCGRRGFNLYSGAWSLECDHPWPYVGAIVAANCAFGILGTGPITSFDRTYVNGCGQGICPGGAGMAVGSITGGMDNTIVYLNHCQYGVNCAGGILLGGSYVISSNWRAIQAVTRGAITMDAAYPSQFEWTTGNTADTNGTDLVVQGNSYIWYDTRDQNQGALAPRCNINPNSVASADLLAGELSFIHMQNTHHNGSGPIGPSQPDGPQAPVQGPAGPTVPPGNVPFTPAGGPAAGGSSVTTGISASTPSGASSFSVKTTPPSTGVST